MPLTTVDPGLLSTNAQYNGFKNRIINGAMMIDQRNAGASVTPTTDATYTIDRWSARLGQASKYSVQQNAGSVTPPAGFTNYLGVTSLSAYSLLASDYFAIQQGIEGLNLADLGWGTANAQTVALSFWVRSSLTGTFSGALQNRLSNRTYPFTYTVNAANTWEYKTATIAGDTSGTWDTDNRGGIYLYFSLGMGSNRSGTANAWNAGNTLGVSGATSVVGTNGATFYITGVQLEKGSTATSFDYRSYGTELALCQRYCIVYTQDQDFSRIAPGSSFTTTVAVYQTAFPVEMRAIPTITTTDLSLFRDVFPARVASPSALVWSEGSRKTAGFNTTNTGFTVGQAGWFSTNNANARITFSAEL
jgi:hypothetical protein